MDLVIDADILRSSGLTESPTSTNARLLLEAVAGKGHRLVQTTALKLEHDKHASRFAKTWRARMVARKQFVFLQVPENLNLRSHLARAQNPESAREEEAVLKDTHLLEAAAAGDLRVLSKDKTALGLFKKGCPLPKPFGQIVWGDLTQQPDATIAWIKQDCPDQKDWRLCP